MVWTTSMFQERKAVSLKFEEDTPYIFQRSQIFRSIHCAESDWEYPYQQYHFQTMNLYFIKYVLRTLCLT